MKKCMYEENCYVTRLWALDLKRAEKYKIKQHNVSTKYAQLTLSYHLRLKQRTLDAQSLSEVWTSNFAHLTLILDLCDAQNDIALIWRKIIYESETELIFSNIYVNFSHFFSTYELVRKGLCKNNIILDCRRIHLSQNA